MSSSLPNPYEPPTQATKVNTAARWGYPLLVAVVTMFFVLLCPIPIIDAIAAGFAGGFIGASFTRKTWPVLLAGVFGAGIAVFIGEALLFVRTGEVLRIDSWGDLIALPLLCFYSLPGSILVLILSRVSSAEPLDSNREN